MPPTKKEEGGSGEMRADQQDALTTADEEFGEGLHHAVGPTSVVC